MQTEEAEQSGDAAAEVRAMVEEFSRPENSAATCGSTVWYRVVV